MTSRGAAALFAGQPLLELVIRSKKVIDVANHGVQIVQRRHGFGRRRTAATTGWSIHRSGRRRRPRRNGAPRGIATMPRPAAVHGEGKMMMRLPSHATPISRDDSNQSSHERRTTVIHQAFFQLICVAA